MDMDNKGEKRNGRDEKGRFIEGEYEGGPGRPPITEADKIKKKAIAELVKEYKESLAEALPEISPVLMKKAIEGDMANIKEINSIIVGEAPKRADIEVKWKPFDDIPKDTSVSES